MYSALFGVVVGLVALAIILAIKAYTPFLKYNSYKKNDAYKELGEYGKLLLELDEIKSPYSGRPLTKTVTQKLGFIIYIVLVYFLYGYINSITTTFYEFTFWGSIAVFVSSLVIYGIINIIELIFIKNKITKWQRENPEMYSIYSKKLT
jgi:VanZ family protein